MGVRLALGARERDVVGLVLRYGLALAVLGVVLGTGVALTASRVLEGLVWGVETTDPVTFAGTAGLLVLAAMLASLLPARRAARTDPLQTLRAE
jgi:ABC-type antimicrobial peptide transport system permease subunit